MANVRRTSLNLDFELVNPNGQIYCYDGFEDATMASHVVLIQLLDTVTLKVEAQTHANCTAALGGGTDWVFGSTGFTYVR